VRGVGLLDLSTKAVVWLPMEGKHALNGIDGLYVAGSSLIATQSGTAPERVIRFAVNDSKTNIVSEAIIERATPTLGAPTHGVIVGNYFYFIANSGWDVLDDHGVLLQGKSLPTASIRRAKITNLKGFPRQRPDILDQMHQHAARLRDLDDVATPTAGAAFPIGCRPNHASLRAPESQKAAKGGACARPPPAATPHRRSGFQSMLHSGMS